jgi:hypothetical protein
MVVSVISAMVGSIKQENCGPGQVPIRKITRAIKLEAWLKQ